MSINPTPKAGAGTTTPSTNPQSTVEKQEGQLSNRHVSASPPSSTHAPIPPPRNESLKARRISTTKTTTKSGFQLDLNELNKAMRDLSTEVPKGELSSKLEELEMILAKTDSMAGKNLELSKGFETLALSLADRLDSHEKLDFPRLSDVDKKAVTLLKKLATFSQGYSDKFHSPDMGLTKNIKYFLQERNARLRATRDALLFSPCWRSGKRQPSSWFGLPWDVEVLHHTRQHAHMTHIHEKSSGIGRNFVH